jgi:ABC-type phosphate transport system permease subunit
MGGLTSMRTLKSIPAACAGIIAVVMAVPADADAESFPSKASNYVSDHTGYFVGALLVAILILLLIVRITQRRAKQKEANRRAPAAAAPAPAAQMQTPPPNAA